MTRDTLTIQAVAQGCADAGLPVPVTEHRFHPVRKHRFDLAWPAYRLALEIQGGVWVGGKHGRGSGILRDYEKLNLAASRGWRVLQFTPDQAGEAVAFLEKHRNELFTQGR